MTEFLLFILVGFVAQLVDGALGMAFGIIATSLLLSVGIPPAVASATVHTAECFTSGASALSHHAFGNVNRRLFRALVLPGMLGAAVGAFLLSRFPGDIFRPIVASTLIARGNTVRMAIGSTNAVEFFVALSASVTFVLSLGALDWRIILGLAVGGAIGAPLGAWACKHVPIRPAMIVVGSLVIAISLRTLLTD